MGKRAGKLFRGTSIFYTDSLDAVVAARDIAEDPREDLTLEHRFFFGHHQGYKVYFFANDHAVYSYVERHPGEIQRLDTNFLSWLWHAYDNLLESRKESRRLFEERQVKRAAMGLPIEEYGGF